MQSFWQSTQTCEQRAGTYMIPSDASTHQAQPAEPCLVLCPAVELPEASAAPLCCCACQLCLGLHFILHGSALERHDRPI